jgi:hypothetical protein
MLVSVLIGNAFLVGRWQTVQNPLLTVSIRSILRIIRSRIHAADLLQQTSILSSRNDTSVPSIMSFHRIVRLALEKSDLQNGGLLIGLLSLIN